MSNLYSGLAEGLANSQKIKAARADSALKAQQLQMQQEELGIQKQKFRQDTTIFNQQQEEISRQKQLRDGVNEAFSNGGFESALDYLHATDMSMYLEVNKAKSSMDTSILQNAGITEDNKRKKVETLTSAYTMLGKFGAQIMKVDPNERSQLYQSTLPLIKAIYPEAPDAWSKDTENMFTMSMGASMPDSILYGADKLAAKAQTDIGKVSQDINLLRAQGISEDDSRIVTLKNRLEASYKDAENAASDTFRYAKNEDAMRQEYTKLSGNYLEIQNMFVNIKDYGNTKPTAAGDMLLINSYQRILDPGSVVREGEYASVKNAGSWSARTRAYYNAAIDGKLLSDSQRQDFLKQASTLMQRKEEQQEKLKDQISRIAVDRGYDPTKIILDFSPATAKQAASQQAQMPDPSWTQNFMKLNPGATEQDATQFWQHKNAQKGGQQSPVQQQAPQPQQQPIGEGNPPFQAGRSMY